MRRITPDSAALRGEGGACRRPWGRLHRRRLLHAPDFEIVLLVVVAGDEGVLVAAFGVNVGLGDQERRLHESAWRLVMEGAVELVDRLPRLQFDRLADRHHLILIALADAVVGRTIAIGRDELHLGGIDAARAQDRHGEIPVVVADRSRVEGNSEALNPARGELWLTLRRFGSGRVDIVEHFAPGALLDLVLGRGRFDLGDRIFVVAEDDDMRLAVGIGDRPIRLGLADLSRILLDVDEEIEIGLRSRQARGVEADELDSLRHAGLDRVLQTGGVGKECDAVRLQGDRLVHAGEPRRRAALAVDDGDVPTELFARFLDVNAVEMRNVVLLVAGQKHDLLAGLGFRGLGRPLPGGLRSGVFGDRRLGVGYRVGKSGRGGEHRRKSDGADEQGLPAHFNFHGASSLFRVRPFASNRIHFGDRAPQLERMMSFGGRMMLSGEPSGDLMRRRSSRAASSPISRAPMATVVKAGRCIAPSGILSKPITATSRPGSRPRSIRPSMTPSAQRSLWHSTAVGAVALSWKSWPAAAAPPSRVGRQLTIGPTGNPKRGRMARKASVRSRAGDTRRAPPTKAMRLCPSRIKCSAASVMPSRKSALT